jgi:hypothetical protein
VSPAQLPFYPKSSADLSFETKKNFFNSEIEGRPMMTRINLVHFEIY